MGYGILEAATADEAIQRFDESDGRLDLLIADVNLPLGPSGIRAAMEMRSSLPFLRIILTSGFPPSLWDDQDAAELSELPSDSVVTLQKPFPLRVLLQIVHRLVGMPVEEAVAV